MGLFDNLTYAFSGSAPAGDPGSPQALDTRRKIALAMLGRDRKGYPKNVGEGLTAIGDALGERSQLAQLDAQQAAFDKWGIEHPPPRASSMMGQPPAAAAPAATGPRADAGAPPWLTGAQYPTQTATASFPEPQTTADASPQLPPTAPPVQDAGTAPQDSGDLTYPQTAANIPSDIISDVPGPGVQRASLPPPDPNIRARVAQTVQAQQGGLQPNPMLAGQQPAAMPSTFSPDDLGSPPEAANNRPIEVPNVKLAQAAIGTAPNIPEINQVWPPVAAPPVGPVKQPDNAPYNQLQKDGADLEQWGIQRGDPRYVEQGKLMQQLGKQQQDRENADLQKKYELDRQRETQDQMEQRRVQQNKGLTQKQLEEQTAKAADAQRANRFGGAIGYQKFTEDMAKGHDAIQPLANTLPMYDQAKTALREAYTGTGADIKLDANKMLRALGVPGDYTPSVATEMLKSRMSAIAAGFVKGTVGGQNISNQDVKFVQQAYSGDISMEPESLRRLLNITQRAAIDTINQHNDRLNGVAKHPDDSIVRDMYRVPMQYGKDAEILKQRGNEQEIRDFFDKKYGKGHADALLRGRPYGD